MIKKKKWKDKYQNRCADKSGRVQSKSEVRNQNVDEVLSRPGDG